LKIAMLTEAFHRIAEPLGCYWVGGGNTYTPQRTIASLCRVRELCLLPAGRDGEQDLPGWYHYGMGRACYHLSDYRMARRHMSLALHGRLFPIVRLKAAMTWCGSVTRGWTQTLPKSENSSDRQ
jgi:hypothetical protein